MKLFNVRFWIYIEEKKSRELGHSTLFANGYDHAVEQVTAVFGSYKKFEINNVEPMGTPSILEAKELVQLS